MHVTHTKHRRKGRIKIVCDLHIVLNSSVHDIQQFCSAMHTYVEINDGINMLILPESEE